MRVSELIHKLRQLPPNAIIYGSGDYMGEADIGAILPDGTYTEYIWSSSVYSPWCKECSGPYTEQWLEEQYGGHWDTCPNRHIKV